MVTTRIAIVCPKLIFSSNLGDVDEKKNTHSCEKITIEIEKKYPKYFYLNISIFFHSKKT